MLQGRQSIRKWGFVFSILLFGSPFFAGTAFSYYPTSEEECSPVDLRNHFSFKIRDQGTISWCYAHAGADYLQYYFKVPTQISAADIAIQYNLRRWPRLNRWFKRKSVAETGFLRGAMWDAVNSGYCAEEDFPSDTWTRLDLNGKTSQKLLLDAFEDLFQLQENIYQGFFLSADELPYTYKFKNITSEKMFEILSESSRSSLLDRLRHEACDAHRVAYPGSLNGIGRRVKGPNAFVNINQFLSHKMPVSTDYFYGFLNDLDYYRKSINELHTTLLVGRRFNAKAEECQYLIKNSYGDSCADYDSRIECDHGYVWVNESDFYGALITYVYIQETTRSPASDSGEETPDVPDDQWSEDEWLK